MNEAVSHPSHYNQGGPIGEDGTAQFEVIKIIEDLGWGFEFCMGNALKYILRAPHKGAEEQDLKKARWYLDRAQRHHGDVRGFMSREIDINKAIVAWGLVGDNLPTWPSMAQQSDPSFEYKPTTEYRLALAVACIGKGDKVGALRDLDVYMEKFSPEASR